MASWRLWRARVREETRAALESYRRSNDVVPAPTAHLLAISDLHLGHDLKRGRQHGAEDIPSLDRHLGDFLDHYREHREDGLPWRLVIVGDMVDFIAITQTPADDELVGFEVTDEERLYGLRMEPAKACWKLERVVRRHAYFCAKLAAFLAAGNEVVIVRGNHDPDWAWPEVQTTFRNAIASAVRMLPASQTQGDVEALRHRIRERIEFREWFYFEPGRFYAEHGHFYDEYSATDDMTPTGDGPRVIREPISTLAHRYFANKHTSLDLNEVERWGLMDFIRWGLDGGRFVRTLGDYFAMCGRVLAFSARASLATTRRSLRRLARSGGEVRETMDERLERVRTALQTVRSDYEDLARSILALTRPPAEQSVLATAQMLYVDRILLGAFTGAAVASVAMTTTTHLSRFSALTGVLIGAAALNLWLGRARVVDSHPKLLEAARRVAALFRVPVVVMGHSHRVVNQPVSDEARYYNLGTWVAPSRDGNEGPAGFPHVVVGSSGAALRRWTIDTDKSVGVVA